MVELSDIVKRTVIGIAVLGISYSSLEAQHRTGSDYIQGAKLDRYQVHCSSNRGRETNMNRYEKSTNSKSCNFNSKRGINSKEYKPLAYENRSECVSRNAKKYDKGYNKIRRKHN